MFTVHGWSGGNQEGVARGEWVGGGVFGCSVFGVQGFKGQSVWLGWGEEV